MIFVPPRFAATRSSRPRTPGIALIVAITEGIPAHDELRRLQPPARNRGVRLSARTARASSRPARRTSASSRPSFFKEGNVGVVSRSGTLTYQIGNELAQRGFGNSSIVGIGGDPVPGTSFIDVIAPSRPTTRPS
jgi:succinyl-CoA synthetase alpha subunit